MAVRSSRHTYKKCSSIVSGQAEWDATWCHANLVAAVVRVSTAVSLVSTAVLLVSTAVLLVSTAAILCGTSFRSYRYSVSLPLTPGQQLTRDEG